VGVSLIVDKQKVDGAGLIVLFVSIIGNEKMKKHSKGKLERHFFIILSHGLKKLERNSGISQYNR